MYANVLHLAPFSHCGIALIILYLFYKFGARERPMSDLIDDVSRMLATPMPRRKAFKTVAKFLLGTALLALGTVPAWADSCASCCANGKNCNAGSSGTYICCGNKTCATTGAKQVCCGTNVCPSGCCNTKTNTCCATCPCVS
jgi:hypothetical protein